MRRFENIARIIRVNRHKVGLSQNDIAKLIGFSYSGQFISNLERGLCSIPAKKVKATSEVLDIDTNLLIQAMLQDEKEYLESVVEKSGLSQEKKEIAERIKQHKTAQAEKREQRRCQKIIRQAILALSAIQEQKTETVSTTYIAEKPIPSIGLESGTLSPLVRDAINNFFTANL